MVEPISADMERVDLRWIRDSEELSNQAEPERAIRAILQLLQDHRDEDATAAAIDMVETEWRAFEKAWNGRWDQEPRGWKDADARGAQREDAGHVAVHLRSVLWNLRKGLGGNQLPLRFAWLAARALAEREQRLAALRRSGGPDEPGPVP